MAETAQPTREQAMLDVLQTAGTPGARFPDARLGRALDGTALVVVPLPGDGSVNWWYDGGWWVCAFTAALTPLPVTRKGVTQTVVRPSRVLAKTRALVARYSRDRGETENHLLREAIRQITFAHHEDRDYCGPCRRALKTFGLLPE
jgi:hypothetical protein